MNNNELILVLNCVESNIQIVLGEVQSININNEIKINQNLLYTSTWTGGSQGVEKLAPALEFAFEQSGRDIQALTKIAVIRGAGSFTGIRLGLTTAAALKRSTHAKLAGLLFSDCLAYSVENILPNAALLAVVCAARTNLLYLNVFQKLQGKLKYLTDALPLVLSTEQSVEAINEIFQKQIAEQANTKLQLYFLGSSLLKNSTLFKQAFPTALFLTPSYNLPCPYTLLNLAFEADSQDEDLEPLYLRMSDAEDNIRQIAKGLGLDPAEAEKTLIKLKNTTEHIES